MSSIAPECVPVCRYWEATAASREAVAALAPGEVQVWLAPVPARAEDALSLLDPEERERGARIVNGEPRRRFVAGRMFLRDLLGARLGCGGDVVRLEPGPGGKPRLAGPEAACRFNLAHGGGWLAVALAVDRDVGVDLEALGASADGRALAPAVCSVREAKALWALPAAERQAAFLRAWTRKEAILKAAGIGLGGPVSPAAIETLPEGPAREVFCPSIGGSLCRWRVADFAPPPGCVGAVAWGITPAEAG